MYFYILTVILMISLPVYRKIKTRAASVTQGDLELGFESTNLTQI